MRIDWPIASSALEPKMRVAAGFQDVDDAVEVLADDRVVRRLDNLGQVACGEVSVRVQLLKDTQR